VDTGFRRYDDVWGCEDKVKEVDAVEVQDNLDSLLDLVERKEEIIITRSGKAVARLVPAPQRRTVDPEEARAAMERIRARAKEAGHGPFDWEEWKAYRDEGRR
jgi:prevent-host-death family protein